MTITAKYGQTIFDIALIAYQDASRAVDLIHLNPQIDSLVSDLTGVEITFTPEKITEKEVIKTVKTTKSIVTINNVQTLFDVALQYYGSAENVYQLIQENGIDSILSSPEGIDLKYTVNNTYVPVYFRQTGGTIATKYPYTVAPIINTFYRISTSGNIRISGAGNRRVYK